jgi:2-polyprenyl-3-methyl-5-hydroxy-6-metoxy-1,4-benzoquinol methylase
MRHKYDYQIDLDDDSAQARVLRMVGQGKRVLEIGAGRGAMTRILREAFNCRMTALEIDEESIQVLTPLCERVFRTDLNDPSWSQALQNEGGFDVVVVADVLEHLYDPWSALQQTKGLIGTDGYLVVSLPHAGHHAILASLLDENFEYRETGLLDKTHIRFFAMKNIQDLFDGSGLAIVDAQFVIRFPESTELSDSWGKIPASTRIALLRNKFGMVYQVVVKAVPAAPGVRGISLLELPVEGVPGTVEHAPAANPAEVNRSSPDKVKVIAFFLTQFHPTPENDRWWGKGFTEWTNVTKAEPLFEGHYQPHLPADLGFYDLRLREVRHEQIALARQFGVDGFCYYYYWFSGTRILNRPLDDMLQDPESSMPFCLCWANENWTRRWDGADREILIAQRHLPTDDVDFIASLIPFFRDPRYIRLNGAPFLIVYQPQSLPDPPTTAARWREYCEKVGIGPIHICAALTNDNDDYAHFGFDSGLEFPPHNCSSANVNDLVDFYSPFHGRVVEYQAFASSYLERQYANPNVFRTVTPCWDQTPRVGSRSFMLLNGTPANYEYWLSESLRRTSQNFPSEERMVFINAWNEWAEGCHLEPDRRYQRQFLEATLRAKHGRSEKTSFEDVGLPKAAAPRINVRARLDEVSEELSRERELRTNLERDLANERERLLAVYRDLATKREQLAAAEKERAAPRGPQEEKL